MRSATWRVEMRRLKVEDHPPGNHGRRCALRKKLWSYSHDDEGLEGKVLSAEAMFILDQQTK